MKSGYVEINTNTLKKTINSMSEQQRSLGADICNMYADIRELDTMWEGSANKAFQKQFDMDCDEFMQLLDVLGQYIESLEKAGREYIRCENDVAGIIKDINV